MYYILCFIGGFLLGALLLLIIFNINIKKDLSKNDKIAFLKNDIILEKNKEYKLKPGVYTIVTTVEGVSAFNLKVNGIVKEYKHNSSIVLSEKDTIMAVSHTVILRK